MPKWPEKRQIIGTNVPRLDGALKASGKAKYSFDRNLEGLLFGKILRSKHAHAKIVDLDLAPAEALPGVKATTVIKQKGSEVFYAGDEIAAVAAETEEQAREALRAIRIQYEVLPHAATEEEGLRNRQAELAALKKAVADAKDDAARQKAEKDLASRGPQAKDVGDVAKAFQDSAATVEGTYGVPVLGHLCWESHGLVAHWVKDDELVVYCSTQAVGGTASGLKQRFGNVKVTCETPFMGGGFGSKFGPDIQGFVAAELAKKARRPVKLLLERDEEHLCAGNRPSLFAKAKAGAAKDGTWLAFDVESYSTGGHSSGGGHRFPYVFTPTAQKIRHQDVAVNAGNQRAWRAPGHPQACAVMDQVATDLAAKLEMDPVEFFIKNLPNQAVLKPIWERELRLGAERIGWKQKYHAPGDKTPGPIKRGVGCAIGTWGGRAGGAQATCTVQPDGSVEIKCGTQDLGTGTTTLVPIVAAEILGLQIKDITGRIGSSIYPPAGGSGGSTSCGGVSLAVAVSCMKALDEIFKKVAPQLGAQPADLEAEDGRVYLKADPKKGVTWKEACAALGAQAVETSANQGEGQGMSSEGVGGAQFAEVAVDVETGEVRMQKIVAVADCGLVMNRLLCESQVYGGVVQGLCGALFEERRMDPKTGLQLNPDVEWYKVCGHSDIGDVEVHLLDYPERGVIGIGEPPCIPIMAAVANAVHNALGVRVGVLPLTPKRILEALAKK